MPEVSRFSGMTIQIYHDDHPGPHFHVIYAGRSASFDLTTMTISRGRLPNNQRRRLTRWARAHRDELMANWERAANHEPVRRISSN